MYSNELIDEAPTGATLKAVFSRKDIPLSIDNVSEEFSYESNNAS